DDEIAFVQLAEIDLGAITAQLFRPLEAAPAMRGVATEQLRARKNDQFSVRKNETARESSFEQLDAGDRLAHDFAEPLDFAFGLEINEDAKFGGAPIAQTRGELRALRFDEHKIAHGEIAYVAAIECAAKIFRHGFAQPAFADQDIGIAIFLLGRDLNAKMIGGYVIADEGCALFGGFEQDVGALQIADRYLRVDVEFAKRLDVVAKIFDSNRARRLPGKQIDY